jgi:hypothetical protein
MDSGRLTEVPEAIERIRAISGDSSAKLLDANLDLFEGRWQQALEKYRSQQWQQIWQLLGTAMAEHSLGHPNESRHALEEAIHKYGDSLSYQYAMVYAWRNDTDAAFQWLERAYQVHDGGLIYLNHDPVLASLRGDLRYAALLKKLNLPRERLRDPYPLTPRPESCPNSRDGSAGLVSPGSYRFQPLLHLLGRINCHIVAQRRLDLRYRSPVCSRVTDEVCVPGGNVCTHEIVHKRVRFLGVAGIASMSKNVIVPSMGITYRRSLCSPDSTARRFACATLVVHVNMRQISPAARSPIWLTDSILRTYGRMDMSTC